VKWAAIIANELFGFGIETLRGRTPEIIMDFTAGRKILCAMYPVFHLKRGKN
jgi:hypothetical protein